MGNSTVREVTLDDAVDWVEYVNGPRTSQMGALRAANGHPDPYNVKFWCIGNENYLGVSVHKAESAEYYGEQLAVWSKMLKCVDPNLSLVGVGRTTAWNRKVLARSGEQLDYLTLHYYITAQVNDCKLQSPERTLFAPVRVEENLKMNIDLLKSYNKNAGRDDNPIRFSIDEWNNRHSVYNALATPSRVRMIVVYTTLPVRPPCSTCFYATVLMLPWQTTFSQSTAMDC